MKLIRDLFMSIDNKAWELARFIAAWSVLSYSFAFLWALVRNNATLDYASVGTGYGLVLAGAAALIFAKDSARTNAVTAANPAPPVTVGPNEQVNVGGGQ